MSLAAWVRRCPATTRRPSWPISAAPTYGASTEAGASFTWRMIRSSPAPERGCPEQADPAPGADTAHPDNPAGDVDDPVAIEEEPTLVGEGRPVVVDHLLDLFHVVAGGIEVQTSRVIMAAYRATYSR